jgi:hypothetical protein
MSNPNEQYIRNQLARYRGVRAINMIKALAFVLLGGVMLYLAASDKFFPNGEIPDSATIGKTLGKQGVMAVAIGIAALAIIIGIIWFLRLLRDLRVGYKTYEQALRSGVQID